MVPVSAPEPVVHSVTTAPARRQDDSDFRLKRYLLTMAVRTLCFVLMPFVPGFWRWVCLAGAAVLPYVAVVMANAVAPRMPSQLEATPAPPRALPTGRES